MQRQRVLSSPEAAVLERHVVFWREASARFEHVFNAGALPCQGVDDGCSFWYLYAMSGLRGVAVGREGGGGGGCRAVHWAP